MSEPKPQRRTIKSSGVPWLGWRSDKHTGILDYFEKCSAEQARYFATLFLTGCRVSEAVQLKPSQFVWNDEGIVAHNALVLKHYDFLHDEINAKIPEDDEKHKLKRVTTSNGITRWVGHKWQTQPRAEYRNIFIKRTNELDDYARS